MRSLGEQSVWRRLYPTVYELPAGYCALRTADLNAEEWARVHVLHDPHLIHKSHRDGWERAALSERVNALDRAADQHMIAHFQHFFAPPPRAPARRSHAAARAG